MSHPFLLRCRQAYDWKYGYQIWVRWISGTTSGFTVNMTLHHKKAHMNRIGDKREGSAVDWKTVVFTGEWKIKLASFTYFIYY